LGLALLALLLLFTVLQNATTTATRAYDPTSAAPDGLLALHLWLTDLGYTVEETMGNTFQLPAITELLFILPNAYLYTKEDAAAVEQWVIAGGTAVIVGPQPRDEELHAAFGVQLGTVTPLFFTVTPQQPLLSAVTAMELTGELPALDLHAAPAAVPVLANAEGQVTAAVQRQGAGTVWHLSRHHSLTNAHLRDPAQAALSLAFLRQVRPGGTIRLDTYHLWGPTTAAAMPVQTLQEWLYYTPWGWALLFGLVVTAVVLLLQGRRLGPPLPAQATVRRREAAEYVMAMANLARRARHRDVIAQHHKRRLKRLVSHRAHIDAGLNDDDFVQQLAARAPHSPAAGTDATVAQVRAALQGLDQATDERALVEAVAAVDTLVKRKM
jgi:hypothetical protein